MFCREHPDAPKWTKQMRIEDVARKDSSIAWTLMATFSTFVLSEATLEGTKLILHCKITWKSSTSGSSTSMTAIPSSNQVWLQEEKIRRKTNGIFHRRGSCERTLTLQNHDRCTTVASGKWSKTQFFGIILKRVQDKGSALWQTRSNAIIFHNSVPGDCHEKVVDNKTEEILFQKTHLSPRLPPKDKSAWQVRHEDHDQRGTNAGQPAADEVTMDK